MCGSLTVACPQSCPGNGEFLLLTELPALCRLLLEVAIVHHRDWIDWLSYANYEACRTRGSQLEAAFVT